MHAGWPTWEAAHIACREWPAGRPHCRADTPLTTDSQGRVQGMVTSRQVGIGVVPGFVIVVLHIEVTQLAVFYAQGTAGIVDILPVQCLYKYNILKL